MKKAHILLVLCFALFVSCGLYKRVFSIVSNKFPDAEQPVNTAFKAWNKDNLYIMRLELKKEYKITYEEQGEIITELSDYPLKDYKLLTQPDWDNQNVVEEVYLYLDDFDNGSNSGAAVYMSSMPLKADKAPQLMFCNNEFISTYAINHVMKGEWKRNGEDIKLVLNDKSNELILNGFTKIESVDSKIVEMIEFTTVNHPKPMNKKDKSLFEIRDVFEVDPNDVSTNGNEIKGIRFFQNNDRVLVHPDWDIIKKRSFDYVTDSIYYSKNLDKRKITDLIISNDDDKHRVYFKIHQNGQIVGSK